MALLFAASFGFAADDGSSKRRTNSLDRDPSPYGQSGSASACIVRIRDGMPGD